MIAIISILLNFHLLPLPVDQHSAPDAQEVAVTKISSNDDLAHLSESFFEKPFSELVLKNHYSPADMAESGLYDGAVFYVYDNEGNKIGVIKTIPSSDQEDQELFRSEVESLQKFQKMSFRHFHSIKILGDATGDIDGEENLILAETVAKGVTINQLIKDFSKMSSPSGKKEAFLALQVAVKETGAALGELHAKSPKMKANPEYLKKYNNHLPGPYGIIHGDAHPGNIFYDKKTNQITFIDFQMTPPISKGGPAGVDIAQFLVSLELMTKYRDFSDQQVEELREAFLQAYRENGPKISDQEIVFYEKKVFKRYARMSGDSLKGRDGHQARFIKDYSIAVSASSSSSSAGSKS